ncbi:MAG: hypothetical protein AAGF48_15710, partial [Pseudomonadota bacterium]
MTVETSPVTIASGIPEDLLLDAAQLYYDGRLKRFPGMLPREVTMSALSESLDPDYALSAVGPNGALLGIATFAQKKRGFWRPVPSHPEKTIGFRRFIRSYLTGAAMLQVRSRARRQTSLLLEGVFVSVAGLQHEVGEPLLDGVIAEAKRLGMTQVEVIV